ncbi:MAG: hypothetical protein IJN76_01535 [Clostridia bacterium]|nr:hypothetical protein [Clostridia bacterium]
MKRWLYTLGQRFPSLGRDSVIRVLVIVGVLGMLLIALSECAAENPVDNPASTVTAAQIEAALETRMTDLLEEVDGVGRCRVLITLESEERAVYATDTAQSGDATSESYLTVDTATGPAGLLLTRIQPIVRGVVVVCAGAEDPTVCQRVRTVLVTAFHISERRICVVPQK